MALEIHLHPLAVIWVVTTIVTTINLLLGATTIIPWLSPICWAVSVIGLIWAFVEFFRGINQ